MDTRKHEAIEQQALQYVSIEDEYTEIRTLSGFILPGKDTHRLMIVSPKISGEVFGYWRKQLNAKVFSVQVEANIKANLETYKEIKGYK